MPHVNLYYQYNNYNVVSIIIVQGHKINKRNVVISSVMYKHLAHENLAETYPLIIPYMVVNNLFITLYSILTRSLHANYLCARYTLQLLYDNC